MIQQLLNELFVGNIETLREFISTLSEKDRAASYKQISPILKKLYSALNDRYRDDIHHPRRSYIRDYNPQLLCELYQQNPAEFLTQEWQVTLPYLEHNQENGLYATEFVKSYSLKITAFVNRIRAVEVGLGNQRVTEQALKRRIPEHYGFYDPWDYKYSWLAGDDNSILWLGRILLDRDVEWRQTLFFKLCEKITEWQNRYCTGFADLLMEAQQRFPHWQAEIEQYYGKAMIFDGFSQLEWHQKYPHEMLMAGLSATQYAPRNYASGLHYAPVTNGRYKNPICQRLAQEPEHRRAYIELILREMLTPHRPEVLYGWRILFNWLKVNEQELQEFRYAFIDLTQSLTNDIALLGIEGLAKFWRDRTLSASEIIPALCIALNSQNQPTAINAAQLIKQLLSESDFDVSAIVVDLIQVLSSPHKQVRFNIIRLLNQYPQALNSDHLAQLTDLIPALSISEQEELKSLLPNSIPVPADNHNRDSDYARLAELIATAEQDRQWPQQQRQIELWSNYLKNYLNHKEQPTELEPLKGDLNYALIHDFQLLQSASQLLEKLLIPTRELEIDLDHERILAAIVTIPYELDNEQLVTLQPLIDTYCEYLKDYSYFASIFHNIKMYAYLWSRVDKTELTEFVKYNENTPLSSLSWLWRIKGAIRWLQKGIRVVPLAIPTNNLGWLDPVTFAERFIAVDTADVEIYDLITAFYRLVNLPSVREKAWSILAERVKDQTSAIERSICLALGDQESCTSALNWFSDYFQQHPPNLIPFQLNYIPKDIIEAVLGNYLSAENLNFQLFYAAMRSRYGLADISELCASIKTTRMVTYNLMLANNNIEPVPKLFQSIFDKELFRLEPIKVELLAEYLPEQPDKLQMRIFTILTPLQPYLNLAQSYHKFYKGYTNYYRNENGVFKYPLGVQRLFEFGIAALKRDPDAAFDIINGNNISFAAGRYFQVEISSQALTEAAKALTYNESKIEEKIIDLYLLWLKDGRATPISIAAAMAAVCRETSKGLKYLFNSLISLELADRVGSLLSLLTVEQFFIKGIDNVPTKNLTMMIKKLEDLTGTIGTIRDHRAIAELEKLAGTKKATPIRDTARHLLTRVDRTAVPLEVEIIAQLLEQSLQE